jgi:hypothetical protein
VLKTFAAYASAGAVGCAAPVLLLWIARSASGEANPVWGALAVVAGLGLASGLVTRLMPARWLSIAVIVSAPLCLVALAMFAALAETRGYYWVWVAVAAGSAGAALGGALLGARRQAA